MCTLVSVFSLAWGVPAIESKIALIDGPALAMLMFDYTIGVTRVATYELKRVGSDYLAEE